MPVVLNWNGEELPTELRALPKGRYVLQPVDELQSLTPEENAGLIQALESLRQGKSTDAETVFSRIEGKLRR
ncbi:MAG: hypothetical protein SGI86_12380 [Deltaproteobacteria bacterium]|nr:hypothetical protein [Deltaproteobacteria bacterium]